MQPNSNKFYYTSKRQKIYHFIEGFFTSYILIFVLIAIFSRIYDTYDGINIAGWLLLLASITLIIFLFTIKSWIAIGLSLSTVLNVLINYLIFWIFLLRLPPLGYLFIPPPVNFLVAFASSW